MKTTTYLVLEAHRSDYGRKDPETGLRSVDRVRVVASRATRPAQLKRDQIAVKVDLEAPESAFNPVAPTAILTIPEGLALRGPIEVEATDANEEQS